MRYLWQALADGGIDLWSSDHSPYYFADKIGKAETPGFDTTLSGIPGLETRLPLLFSEGLLTGRLSLARYLDLTSRNAAATYGLAHRKGRIALGLDADLALWDPGRVWTHRPCRPAFPCRLLALRGQAGDGQADHRPGSRRSWWSQTKCLRPRRASENSCRARRPIRRICQTDLSRRRRHGSMT